MSYTGGLIAGVLAGPSIHLWYISFAFILILAISYMKRRLGRTAVFYSSLLMTFLTLFTSSLWEPWSRQVGYPVAQWAQATTPIAIGLLIGTRDASRLGVFALVGTVLCLVYVWLKSPIFGIALPHLIAMVMVLSALYIARISQLQFNVQWLAGTTFGIYLSHPFFLSALKPLTLPDVLWVGFAFVLASLLTLVYQDARRRIGASSFVRFL